MAATKKNSTNASAPTTDFMHPFAAFEAMWSDACRAMAETTARCGEVAIAAHEACVEAANRPVLTEAHLAAWPAPMRSAILEGLAFGRVETEATESFLAEQGRANVAFARETFERVGEPMPRDAADLRQRMNGEWSRSEFHVRRAFESADRFGHDRAEELRAFGRRMTEEADRATVDAATAVRAAAAAADASSAAKSGTNGTTKTSGGRRTAAASA